MSNRTADTRRYFEDAQHHNPWWNGNFAELESVSALTPRSNTYSLAKAINDAYTNDVDERVFPQYGQSGVGKTTTLKQLIATVIDDPVLGIDLRSEELDRDKLTIANKLNPEQVLYVPVEDSQYYLSTADDSGGSETAGLDALGRTISRFSRYHDGDRELIIVDDIGALDIPMDARANELLRHVGDDTVLIVTGSLKPHVTFPDNERVRDPIPNLPRKFIDVLKNEDEELRTLLNYQKANVSEGHISKIRTQIRNPERTAADDPSIAECFDRLYFDVFEPSQRKQLARHTQQYFRHGGFFYRETDQQKHPRTDIVKSSLLLFLYRDVAQEYTVNEPRDLQKLCAIAAADGSEVSYRDLSEILGADRRTVKDRYVNVLRQSKVLYPQSEYSIVRHRRTRLQHQNPLHATILSQRRIHKGFEMSSSNSRTDPDFETRLARTTAVDHAERIQYWDTIEYAETDHGTVDIIMRKNEHVFPFVFAYDTPWREARQTAIEFDPSTGQHPVDNDTGGRSIETENLDYTAPTRFVIEDTLPYDIEDRGTLVEQVNETTICHLPLWLFLLIG